MKDPSAHRSPPLARWRSRLQQQLQPLRNRLLKDPYYRFQSADEVQMAAELGIVIDVNQAAVDDWLRLPGLSIHQARSLVSLAQAGVQFHCLEDVAAALSLPVQRLQPWAPVLRFCYYDASSPATPVLVNPNQASVEQLARVPGMDLYLARLLVHHRQKQGPYASMADLQRRLQLPPDLMAQLMHFLRF